MKSEYPVNGQEIRMAQQLAIGHALGPIQLRGSGVEAPEGPKASSTREVLPSQVDYGPVNGPFVSAEGLREFKKDRQGTLDL